MIKNTKNVFQNHKNHTVSQSRQLVCKILRFFHSQMLFCSTYEFYNDKAPHIVMFLKFKMRNFEHFQHSFETEYQQC